MNTAARAWVRALESGKFRQTQQQLHNYKGYCCLGVACELALKAGIIKQKVKDEFHQCYAYEGERIILPQKVRLWLGLRSSEGYFITPNGVDALITLNDEPTTFKAIAALIKKEPKGLFSATRKKKKKSIPAAKGKKKS